MLTRRAFISTTTLAGSLAAGPALGFSEAEPDEKLVGLYAQSCAARGYHQVLMDEIAELLSNKSLAADLKLRLANGDIRCPFCACAVTVRQ